MKIKYLIIFILFINKVFPQTYKFPEKFNPSYDFKPDDAYKVLNENRDKNIPIEDFNNYVVNYVYDTQFLFDHNDIYMNWNEVESYLIHLLDTIFPKNCNRKNLDVFLNRDVDDNAFCTRYGLAFCNVGLIDKSKNEGYLAIVLLHEAAHYLFKHSLRSAQLSHNLFSDNRFYSDEVKQLFAGFRKREYEADTFALNNMGKLGVELNSYTNYFEMADMKSRVYRYSASYNGMLKASNMPPEKKTARKLKSRNVYASHPSNIERMETCEKYVKQYINNKKQYILDSNVFLKIKKIAHQEVKKISFEKSDYNEVLTTCFIDFLSDSKDVRNLYYIIESLRRIMYVKPELEKTGFLTDKIYDRELFDANQSVLYKPEYFLNDFEQYEKLKNHPFLSQGKKPFNTYKQAFFYFLAEAQKINFNEANFSLSLFYFGNKQEDSCKKYLKIYLDNGGGVNTDFAQNILANGRPYTSGKKMLFVYDNIGNYTKGDFNYYLTKKKKKYNQKMKSFFETDTNKIRFVVLNEMLANNPNLLYQYQKIQNGITSLYEESDIDLYKKIRLTAKESMEQRSLSNKFWKNLLVYMPECYKWCGENNIGKIFYAEVIYQYKDYMQEEEFYNNYTGYYLDFNSLRPYFKDGIRNSFVRKQKEEEIWEAFNDFLYGSE